MYAKLFGSILDSSLWSEELHVRVLFVTMIAMAEREGFVYAARPGLARRAQLSREQVDDALTKLSSPDPDSSDRLRNPESEGQRIEEVDGGWRLLNYPYYRNLRDADNRREQVREAVLRHRAKVRQKRVARAPKSELITDDYGGLPVITSNHGNPSEAEAYSEAEAEKKNTKKPSAVDLVEVWNANRGPMQECRRIGSERRKRATAQLREEPDLGRWAAAIAHAAEIPFCRGEIPPKNGHRQFIGNIDWLLRPETLGKIEEGFYDDRLESEPGAEQEEKDAKIARGKYDEWERRKFGPGPGKSEVPPDLTDA